MGISNGFTAEPQSRANVARLSLPLRRSTMSVVQAGASIDQRSMWLTCSDAGALPIARASARGPFPLSDTPSPPRCGGDSMPTTDDRVQQPDQMFLFCGSIRSNPTTQGSRSPVRYDFGQAHEDLSLFLGHTRQIDFANCNDPRGRQAEMEPSGAGRNQHGSDRKLEDSCAETCCSPGDLQPKRKSS
jgi:hypothetical protein